MPLGPVTVVDEDWQAVLKRRGTLSKAQRVLTFLVMRAIG
jgi:hypothetical protein